MQYEYQCPNCGNEIKLSRKICEIDEDFTCPFCEEVVDSKSARCLTSPLAIHGGQKGRYNSYDGRR